MSSVLGSAAGCHVLGPNSDQGVAEHKCFKGKAGEGFLLSGILDDLDNDCTEA